MIQDAFTTTHRQAIIRAAESHRVPAIYPARVFADDGGLMAYSDDMREQFRVLLGLAERAYDLRLPMPCNVTVARKCREDILVAEVLPNRRVTWRATSNDENS